tara:strand:- start:7810 stop:8397 length:588 start_codon:yes stop_codon:yes gene_type:complete
MADKTLSFNNEIYRKIFHISSLIIPLIYVYTNFINFIIFLTISTASMFIININYNLILRLINSNINLDFIIRDYEKKSLWSASYMILAFLLISIIFPKNVAIISMILGSVCDPLAGLFGQKYGKIKIIHNKTLEGTYVFIISAFLVVSLYSYTVSTYLLLICVLIALTELITPMKYDNVTIPIASSLIFTIYNYL